MSQPSRDDALVEALSEVVGGPVGDHARQVPPGGSGGSWWTPVRILLAVFTITFGIGLVQKAPCGNTHWSSDETRYGRMCYSDIPYVYTGNGLAEKHWPYSENTARYAPVEYPVVVSYFVWAAAEVTSVFASGPSQAVRAETTTGAIGDLPGMPKEVNTYFLVSAVLLFCFGLGAVFFLSGVSPGRPWDAMGLALSPVLVVSALVNWDLIAVFFTAGALWAWTRGKPVWAGIMIGLGVATKLYPLFLLVAFLVDAIRRRRPDVLATTVSAAGVTWVLVNLPALMTNAASWKQFWSFNANRQAELGSFWYLLDQRGTHLGSHDLNVISGALVLIALAGIVVLGLSARHRPSIAQIAFLAVAAFLVLDKVYSPQYVLWLLPLAVLARPRWRDLLIWQACELFYFGAVWLYLGGWLAPGSGTQPVAYQLAIVIRIIGELYLVALVVQDIWNAEPGPEDFELADLDGVEGGRGEADADVDGLADLR